MSYGHDFGLEKFNLNRSKNNDLFKTYDDSQNYTQYVKNTKLARQATQKSRMQNSMMSKSLTNIQSDGAKEGSPNPKFKSLKSKFMDVHKNCSHTLKPKQKEEILGRYLTMTNKLSLTYFK